MSEEKCFCHLNGYAVKDSTARKQIEDLSKKVNEDIAEQLTTLDEKVTDDINTAIDGLRNEIIGELQGEY